MKSRNTRGGGGFRKIPSNSRKTEQVPQSSWGVMGPRRIKGIGRMSVWTQVLGRVGQMEAGAELSGKEAGQRREA